MRMRGPTRQGGALMIEVLVTIVILVIGLLGLMQLQSKLQKSEVESYQRTQALMLAKDMAERIATNRANAASYQIGDPADETSIGGAACPTAVATLGERDLKEWCEGIKGAAELQGAQNVGAMINGRGCVYSLDGGREYQVTVVWQGLTPLTSPDVICGKESPNPYDNGADCVDDKCRRAVSTIVRMGTLPP